MFARTFRLLVAAGVATVLTGTLATATAEAAPAKKHQPLRIVQLSDSYSAGNGSGGYTDRVCYRSPHNYGRQFADSIKATYLNRACSGAVTADLLHPTKKGAASNTQATYDVHTTKTPLARKRWLRKADTNKVCGVSPTHDLYYARHLTSFNNVSTSWTGTLSCQLTAPAQLNAVNKHTDIVLLTIGGNDLGFSSIVVSCLALPEPISCKRAIDKANAGIPAVAKALRHVFTTIRHRSAGHAKVYLLPYPALLNTKTYSIPELVPATSIPGPVPTSSIPRLTYDAGRALADLQARGNKLQRTTVADYNKTSGHGRYHFVGPVISTWAGHGLDPHARAVNSKSWLHPVGDGGTFQYVHPRPVGWNATAGALERYYARHH